ncbi:hypothetical protein [Comamonas sp. CMM02]|uniref:hypothetical protein n=1 Tax=Comamonas sp. CMM02 TaxID=2769307 RepID=UPI00177EA3E4|nr:hypothetical protein [Comamonas sp. CMM02]MBD9402269.1 hypothetical protein [Comamonas sp. CMM02]
MMRRIVCTAAVLLLSGCLLESVGRVNRNDKPYGAQWVKEGVTKEEWLADWIKCGGAANGNFAYEGQGQSNKEYFEGLNAHTTQMNMCMRNLGYIHLNQCDARCL